MMAIYQVQRVWEMDESCFWIIYTPFPIVEYTKEYCRM